jgi:hypothetical protein
MGKKIKLVLIGIFLLCIFVSRSYSWGPLAHLYIIEKACEELGSACPFYNLPSDEKQKAMMNAMGPDVFILVDLSSPKLYLYPNVNIVHSPVPWNTEYENRVNFGYLYLKEAGGENVYSTKTAKAYGWGGHISGDWIAHGQVAKIETPLKETCWKLDWCTSHGELEKLIDHYIIYQKNSKFSLAENWIDSKLVKSTIIKYRKKYKMPLEVMNMWGIKIISVLPTENTIKDKANKYTTGGWYWYGVSKWQEDIYNTVTSKTDWICQLKTALERFGFSGKITSPDGKTTYDCNSITLGTKFIFPALEEKLNLAKKITKEWMQNPGNATSERWKNDYPKNPNIK